MVTQAEYDKLKEENERLKLALEGVTTYREGTQGYNASMVIYQEVLKQS